MHNPVPHISVIVPVYSCDECLMLLYTRLKSTLEPITKDFELILVNDSSPDKSWLTITDLAKKVNRVKGINFSRNFGQHYAISAGLDYARGNWIVVMDCDLQDPPEEIPKLYNKAQEGFDIVYGVSGFRGKDSLARRIFRKMYFKIYDVLAQNNFKTENLSFYIINKKVRNSLVQFREQSRHISSLMRYVGYNITGIEIKHEERNMGKSSYSFLKRFNLAYTGIIAYSSVLLRISFFLGFTFSIISFVAAIFLVINKFLDKYPLPGWASIVILILFSSGLILSFLGIIGMYIEKMFLEVKNRPLYIVDEVVNTEL